MSAPRSAAPHRSDGRASRDACRDAYRDVVEHRLSQRGADANPDCGSERHALQPGAPMRRGFGVGRRR